MQANLSPGYAKKIACNVFPTATPKGTWIVYCPSQRRFSFVSAREYFWLQSLDYLDFFSSEQAVENSVSEFSYTDLIRFSGNSFQMRCAASFLASTLLLDRLAFLGDDRSDIAS